MRQARLTVPVLAAVLLLPLIAWAQAPNKIYRIGWVGSRDDRWDAFQRALAERGWVEGRHFTVEMRRPVQGRLESLERATTELVEAKVDVMVGFGTAYALAAQRASRTVPIVMVTSGFPVEAGVATSLARPGSNVTGNSIYAGGEIFGKALELLREMLPHATTLGVLWDYTPPSIPQAEADIALKELRRAADKLALRTRIWETRAPEDVAAALAQARREALDGLFVTTGILHYNTRDPILRFVLERRLPTASDFWLPEMQAPVLVYAPDPHELTREAARYVDRIFRGASPAELPIQLPSRFVLRLNLKTARAIGLTIPTTLRARADQVIE